MMNPNPNREKKEKEEKEEKEEEEEEEKKGRERNRQRGRSPMVLAVMGGPSCRGGEQEAEGAVPVQSWDAPLEEEESRKQGPAGRPPRRGR